MNGLGYILEPGRSSNTGLSAIASNMSWPSALGSNLATSRNAASNDSGEFGGCPTTSVELEVAGISLTVTERTLLVA